MRDMSDDPNFREQLERINQNVAREKRRAEYIKLWGGHWRGDWRLWLLIGIGGLAAEVIRILVARLSHG
jgi:hypothetical protein